MEGRVIEAGRASRQRHLMLVRERPLHTERAEPTRVHLVIDLALLAPRLWLTALGYRIHVERRQPKLPTRWDGE